MTLLLGGISCLLAVVLAAFSMEVADAAGDRARAQAAADAAALAAVAESAPYGGAAPEHIASRYAALNGAEVVECRCEAGATAMQVTVVVDDVTARARAVIDPSVIGPSVVAFGTGGLHPALRQAIDVLIAESKGAVHVVSGYRSPQEQAALWASALRRYGSAETADDWVAPPGHSMHERGLAVDLGGDLRAAEDLIARLDLPLHSPLSNEPWHFELLGTR